MSEDIEGQVPVLSPPREPPRRKDSVSEAATGSSQGAPWLLRFFEIPFRIRDPTNRDVVLPEVTAWAMDHSARGVLNTVGAYVGLAVLVMASIEAGDSENTVRAGLKPSSLLTATSAIVGVIAAALMPIVGAIVDHTQYRRFMGSASALILTALTGMMLALDLERNNWFFVLIVESILSFFLTVHATASFAYLPDLTPDPSVIPQYTASFLIRQASCQFIFTCLLLILGKVRGSDRSVVQTSIDSSIDATSITLGTCVLCLGYAWGFLFRPRPALSKTPEGQPLIATGFLQVKKTAVIIWTKYRALKWFMLSLLWSPESGSGVVVSVAVSYLGTDIGYSGQDLAKLSLIYLSASVAGALMAKWADSRLNTLNIYRSGLVVFVFGLALCVAIVDGPEDKQMSLGIVPLWGLANGWAYSAQRALIVTLIPKGQETVRLKLSRNDMSLHLLTSCWRVLGVYGPVFLHGTNPW